MICATQHSRAQLPTTRTDMTSVKCTKRCNISIVLQLDYILHSRVFAEHSSELIEIIPGEHGLGDVATRYIG